MITKNEIYNFIKSMGATKAVVGFSGGNDDGGCDEICFYNGKTLVHTAGEPHVPSHYDKIRGTWVKERALNEVELILEAMCKPVYDRYDTFCGEFDVTGEVIYDVENKSVNLLENYRQDYEDDEEVED